MRAVQAAFTPIHLELIAEEGWGVVERHGSLERDAVLLFRMEDGVWEEGAGDVCTVHHFEPGGCGQVPTGVPRS